MRNLKSSLWLFPLLTPCFFACKGSQDWASRFELNPLSEGVIKLRGSPDCSRWIPLQWVSSIPIPFRDQSGQGFKLLFYPTTVEAGTPSIALTPTVAGFFTQGPNPIERCEKLPIKTLETLGRAVPPGFSSLRALDQEKTMTYEALEAVAPLYFQKSPLSPEEVKKLGGFANHFKALAEPGLWPYYYRLNPDFWEWLRKEAGKSIPAA